MRERNKEEYKVYGETLRLCFVAIKSAVRFRLQKRFDPIYMARALPRWIHNNSKVSDEDYEEIPSKIYEDEIAKDIAGLSNLHSTMPWECTHDRGQLVNSLLSSKESSNDKVDRYVSAVSRRIFAEIVKDVTTSQENRLFFEDVKSIFPTFEWTEDEEMGFGGNDDALFHGMGIQ